MVNILFFTVKAGDCCLVMPAIYPFIFNTKVKHYDKLLLVYTGFGFIFESFMTYIQLFVIDAFCFWCFLIEIATTLVFVLSVIMYKKNISEPIE